MRMSKALFAMSARHQVDLLVLEQEWEDAKKKQDKALDSIEKGIGTLKGIGEAMGESLNQQDVVLDTIDEKVGKPHTVYTHIWAILLGFMCYRATSRLKLLPHEAEVDILLSTADE